MEGMNTKMKMVFKKYNKVWLRKNAKSIAG